MTNLRPSSSVALLLLFAAAARADSLATLRHALAALPAKTAVRADIEFTRTRHSHGRLLNDDFDGTASVEVTSDATATRISFRRQLLARSAAHRPTAMTLTEITGDAVDTALDFASDLQRLVARGHVADDRALLYGGRPARILRIELPPDSEAEKAGEPKMSKDTVTVWMTETGLPLAVRRVRLGSVGMLLVHVDTIRTENWTLAQFGDRLIATRSEDRSVVSGSIQHGDASTVAVVSNVQQ